MPKVYNKKYRHPSNAQYVGRPTLLGNPFSHLQNSIAEFKVSSVQEALAKFDTYARERAKEDPVYAAAIKALLNEDLLCWCAGVEGLTVNDPLRCHGQLLIILSEELCGLRSASSSGLSLFPSGLSGPLVMDESET